jgi:hypothetical protein
MTNKYVSRVTSSSRGELFNPLVWPFLLSTLAYGVGFSLFFWTNAVRESSLHAAMISLGPHIPIVWGAVALFTIVIGLTFLLYNLPPAGKFSGIMGFMVWVFATICWAFSGGWLLIASVAIPNMWFWIWQYLSLTKFRLEEREDRETMREYDAGEYDDELNPKDSKIDRDNNRGRDVQSHGSYDVADNGGDTSRVLDSDK